MESCRKKQPLSRFCLWPDAQGTGCVCPVPPPCHLGPLCRGGRAGAFPHCPPGLAGLSRPGFLSGPLGLHFTGTSPHGSGPRPQTTLACACPGCPRFTRSCNGRMGRSVDGARFSSAAGQLVATRHVPAFPASPWLSDKGGMLALQLSSPLTIFAGGETQLLKIEIMRESRSF